MASVTVCIPIAPQHSDISNKAILSVKMQTVKCDILISHDKEQKGPGFLRNRMAEHATTDFLVFLDADDELMPSFIEETLRAYKSRYVYTDWYNDEGAYKEAPDCAWSRNTWHLVTALIPTQFHRTIGGFNENLPALEDSEYYLRMTTSGLCGRRLNKPLVKYSNKGFRSKDARNSGIENAIKNELVQRYGGKSMSCCDQGPQIIIPPGGKVDGDILAVTLWGGNHTELGRSTGRIYPRSGNGQLMWVHPADVRVSPHLWRQVEQEVVEPEPPPVVMVKPDVAKVIRLSSAMETDDPVFAFPAQMPNSYQDIRLLAELSGYQTVSLDDIDPFDTSPLIVLSPYKLEPLDLPRRIICWQLEYAGEYTDQYDNLPHELWASDPFWAKENNAKYVMVGSHPGLAQGFVRNSSNFKYDVTMLGYMVPRRQSIKDSIKCLWPENYPGHGAIRANVLAKTRIMLHVHQHDGKKYFAPQRLAIAAAFKMPVISEKVWDIGDFGKLIPFIEYDQIPYTVSKALDIDPVKLNDAGSRLYNFLCVEHTFQQCIEEALKQ